MDISTTIKFHLVCDIAERIKLANKVKNKETILARYYESFQRHRQVYRQQMNASNDEETGASSFYPVLRCLLPQVDYARKTYDLQINTLGAVYIKVLQLPEDSRDVTKLKARSYTGNYEDYADIVYNVLRGRCREEPSNLNLNEVHKMLDSIADGDRRNTEMVLTRLYELASAQEQKWFIRLILKSMGLGIGEQRIFAVLHPQAKELFQRCSSLQRVCNMLADSNGNSIDKTVPSVTELNLNNVIAPFQHIKPMLCERFPGDIEKIMATDVLYMETKMDGERFQLHYADGRFKFISRNGIDYTKSFGYTFEQGIYTSLLKNIWPKGLISVILDGEMMVWDMQNERFREKGENTDVKHLGNYPNWRPCFIVYDLLYLNGNSLLDTSYVQRMYRVQELIREEATILQTMKPKKVASKEEYVEMFNAAIEAKSEGIVLKKQNSKYLPGVRFGGGWYKDKPDYIQGLTTDFDLLIIGGFYNRTRSFIESFLLGVLHEKSPQVQEVYSVGKVSNIIRQRANLNNLLKEHWKQVEQEPPPMWYHYVATNAEGRPDVWIEPRHSVILQIRAADLAPSGAFALGKSLHFPRIDAWRNDKLWNECMTLQEYKAVYEGENGLKKLDNRETRLEDFTVERKRFKMTPAEKRKQGMQAYEKRFDANEVKVTSDLLEGFFVCVLSGSSEKGYDTVKLKELAVKNGAELVENPLVNEPRCINVAGEENFRVELLKKSKRYDIVRMEWLLRVCEKQHLKLKASDMVSMTPALEKQLTNKPDSDEEVEMDVTLEEDGPEQNMEAAFATVRQMLNAISEIELNGFVPSDADIDDLEHNLFADTSRNIFKHYYGYFPGHDPHLKMMELKFSMLSGHSVKDVKNLLGHRQKHAYVFINCSFANKKLFAELHRHRKLIADNQIHLVNMDWISQSQIAGRPVNVRDFYCDHFLLSK